MIMLRAFIVLVAVVGVVGAARADDISDAIDQARKFYQSGDLANAKQSLDFASQLIGQKNAQSTAGMEGGSCAERRDGRGDVRRVGGEPQLFECERRSC
jgi:hypothetical protein